VLKCTNASSLGLFTFVVVYLARKKENNCKASIIDKIFVLQKRIASLQKAFINPWSHMGYFYDVLMSFYHYKA